jgi:hypothetical protein
LALPASHRRELAARAESAVRQRLSLQTFGQALETLYQQACQEPLTS